MTGPHRTAHRRPRRPRGDEEQRLRRELRRIARRHPRWGWRMAHRLLRRDGQQINHKRIRRLWREEGLRRPVVSRKRRRVRLDSAERLRAERPKPRH